MKQGLAKENKFNTVLCKCKKLLCSKKSQPEQTDSRYVTHVLYCPNIIRVRLFINHENLAIFSDISRRNVRIIYKI